MRVQPARLCGLYSAGPLCYLQDLTVGQFVYVIRKRIKLAPEKAIFIFVDEVLPPTAQLMSAIYEEHKYVSPRVSRGLS